MSVLSREPERSMLGLVLLVFDMYMAPQSHDRQRYALLERGGQRGDPAGVALEGAAENELLGHGCGGWLRVRVKMRTRGGLAVLGVNRGCRRRARLPKF